MKSIKLYSQLLINNNGFVVNKVTLYRYISVDGGLCDWSKPHFLDLVNALHASIDEKTTPLKNRFSQKIADIMQSKEHLIFILLDGFGDNHISRLSSKSLFRKNYWTSIQSVFPSATTAALTSITTNKFPIEHGAFGWSNYFPSKNMGIYLLPFQQLGSNEKTLNDKFRINDFIHVESQFKSSKSRKTTIFLPETILNSAYTNFFVGKARKCGYSTLNELFITIQYIVRNSVCRTCNYIYIPDIDTLSHDFGYRHSIVFHRINEIEQIINRFVSIHKNVRTIISADHGHIHIKDESNFILHQSDELFSMLITPPTGEQRLPFFHVKAGLNNHFYRLFNQRFGKFFLLYPSKVIFYHTSLFGPQNNQQFKNFPEQLGNYIGFPLGDSCLCFQAKDEKISFLKGNHGGLSKDEIMVPLIII